MLCWKKGSYSPEKTKTKNNTKELVTLQRSERLKSIRKKPSKDKKDLTYKSLTIRFTSNLNKKQ